MSVLIKGMDMPKNCDECKLRNGMGKDDGKVIYHCAPLAKWVIPNPLAETNDCPLAYPPNVTSAWTDGEASTYVLQKRGKWLHKKITADFHAIGQCSVCKEIRRIDNFCPNCGADMRGEDQ